MNIRGDEIADEIADEFGKEALHQIVSEMVFKRCDASQKNFTEEARDILIRGVIAYAEDIFCEAGDVRINREDRITDIDKKLDVLRAETKRLEEEQRALQDACRTFLTYQCLREAAKRVEERGHSNEEERRRREEERKRRAFEFLERKKKSKKIVGPRARVTESCHRLKNRAKIFEE